MQKQIFGVLFTATLLSTGWTQSDSEIKIDYTLPTAVEVKAVLDRVKEHFELVTPYRFQNRETGETVTDFSQPQDVTAARRPGNHGM